ncbi:hypothetical protein AB4072_15340 [Microvirga sp. 2MCAF38]|uniref:hypothetical protein n=1 Tax=Microvirga sp. 2MCAF38 TaxID=3232989 RepID=UPI003F9BF8DC
MQPPDENPTIGAPLREELVDALADTVLDVVARLSPVTRLRLLAFMHLFEKPETIRADLSIDASGTVRLTLAQHPGGGTQH